MPWLDETRRASVRTGVAGGAMAVCVCGGSGPERKLQRVGPKLPLYEKTRTAYPTTTQQPENPKNVAYKNETFLQKYGTLKQVTTLPWHFTPKGALLGPIYGIYVG